MSVIGVLFLFLIAIAAVGGLYVIGASTTNAGTITDTYGSTLDAASNTSQSVIQNTTATGLTVASGVILFIGFIVLLIVVIALVAVATKKY